jgi:hypothetical protein
MVRLIGTLATTSQSPPSEEATFGLFMKFPPELRRIIWRFARPNRYLTLLNCGIRKLDGKGVPVVGAVLRQPRLILNAVNQEARYETRSTYAFLERMETMASQVTYSGDVDTIHISASHESGLISIESWSDFISSLRTAGQRVQRLLVDLDFVQKDDKRLTKHVAIFLSMDEVVFVLGKGPTQREEVITAGNISIGGLWGSSNITSRKQAMTANLSP